MILILGFVICSNCLLFFRFMMLRKFLHAKIHFGALRRLNDRSSLIFLKYVRLMPHASINCFCIEFLLLYQIIVQFQINCMLNNKLTPWQVNFWPIQSREGLKKYPFFWEYFYGWNVLIEVMPPSTYKFNTFVFSFFGNQAIYATFENTKRCLIWLSPMLTSLFLQIFTHRITSSYTWPF